MLIYRETWETEYLTIANPELCNKSFKNVISKPFITAPEDYF